MNVSRLLDMVLHGTIADVAALILQIHEGAVLEPPVSDSRPNRLESVIPTFYSSRKRKRASDRTILDRATAHDPVTIPSFVPSATTSDWTSLWSVDLEACVDASPLVVLDEDRATAFVGSHAGIFSAIELDGRTVWTTDVGGRIESTACAVGDLVCFGCYDHGVYFLDMETGEVVWKFETGDSVKCSPCPVDEDVLVGSHDRNLYRLSPSRKEMVWKTDLAAGVFAKPAVKDGTAIVGTLGGTVFAIDLATGSRKWTFDAVKPIFSGPCISSDGTTVFTATVSGTLSALSIDTGALLWTYSHSHPIFSNPVSISDLLVFGTHGNNIIALGTNGTPRWTFRTDFPVYASVSVLGAVVFAVSTKSTLYLLNFETGALLERTTTSSAETYSSPLPLNSTNLLLASRDDTLRLIRRT